MPSRISPLISHNSLKLFLNYRVHAFHFPDWEEGFECSRATSHDEFTLT